MSDSDKESSKEVLTFMLGKEEYGIDILKVQEIRGYDVVKDAHVRRARTKEMQLLAEFQNPPKKKENAGVQYAEAV